MKTADDIPIITSMHCVAIFLTLRRACLPNASRGRCDLTTRGTSFAPQIFVPHIRHVTVV